MLPNQTSLHEEFVKTLLLEWKLKKHLLVNKTIKSIYFGGGTPALLAPHFFEQILNLIEFDPSIEITLEANPENLTLELLQGFKKAGINRLSIGAQSFDDDLLKLLSRTHDSKATIQALAWAKTAGFDNITIDLMYDLPTQTESVWIKTLQTAIQQPITHLSLYNLTIEPETVFFKKRKALTPKLPSPDSSLSMYNAALEILPQGNLLPYEISAFAKPGRHSQHNVGYWTAREFLGFGPSAYSYWNKNRFRNVPHFGKYQKALLACIDPKEESDALSDEERKRELLAVEIRLRRGVDLDSFQQRHGKLPPLIFKELDQLIAKGWVERSSNQVRLTSQGVLFYDSVAVELI